MNTAKIAIAGITGYTGRHLLPLVHDLDVRLLIRPASATKPPWNADARVAAVEQDDATALAPHLTGVETIVCLVGTIRKRFKAGDTYEKVDIGIPAALAAAGKAAGAKRFILLSSYGTRDGGGAYLKAKWKAEQAVRDSGLAWVILRPSMFMGSEPDGDRTTGRKAGRIFHPLFSCVAWIPGLRGPIHDLRPIAVSTLASCINRLVRDPSHDGTVLRGREIWAVGGGRSGQP